VSIFTHRIAGITFRTESDVAIPHLREEPFKQFEVDNGEQDVRNHIRQYDPGDLTLPPMDEKEREALTRSVSFPRRWLANPIFCHPEVRAFVAYCLDHPELVHVSLAWNRAVFRDFARNELYLFYPPEKREDIADPIFVAGYRNILDTFLPNFSAVMFHGAATVRHDLAAVFLAPDEGGKTTVVQLANGAPVLSDDHPILRRDGDVIVVHGTPLGAITSGPELARLGGFFLLEKASCFELIPVKPRDVLQFIWNERMHRWGVLPRNLSLRAFDILYDACYHVPTYRMRFSRDRVDWDAIDAVIAR
jgi:hypothetical protein